MLINKRNYVFLIILISVFFIIIGSKLVDSYDKDWTIVNDTVYINISGKGMITQTPHTLTDFTNNPIVTFTSYLENEQTLDFVFLYNTSKCYPSSVDYYNPHNVTIENSYTCIYEFNYTLNPKYAWCYREIYHEFNEIWINNTVFEHSFEKGNISSKTIWWNETKKVTWVDINHKFKSKNISWRNFTKAYYIKNITFQPNETKTIRPVINVVPGLEENSGKYAIFIKRSSDTLKEAWTSGNSVFLDPFWNTSWAEAYNITINNTDTVEAHKNEVLCLTVKNTGCESDTNSTRLILNGSTSIEFDWYNDSLERICWIANQTIEASTENTDYRLYCNNSGAAQANKTIFYNFDDYYTNTTGDLVTNDASIVSYDSGKYTDANYSMLLNMTDTNDLDWWFMNSTNAVSDEITTVGWSWYIKDYNPLFYGGDSDEESCGYGDIGAWFRIYLDDVMFYDGSAYNSIITFDTGEWISLSYSINWTSDTAQYQGRNYTGASKEVSDSIYGTGTTTSDNFEYSGTCTGNLHGNGATIWVDRMIKTYGDAYQFKMYPIVPDVILGTKETQSGGNNAPNAPTFNNPTCGSTGEALSVILNVTVTDDDGDDMNVSFWNNATGAQIGSTQNNTANNTATNVTWSGLSAGTVYYWYVNSDDGTDDTNSSVCNFTTSYTPTLATKDTHPDSPTTDNDILFNATVTDPDAGETLTCYLRVYINDVYNTSNSSTMTNNTIKTLFRLDSGNTSNGDNITGEYWCGDGISNSSQENDTVTIGNVNYTVDMATSISLSSDWDRDLDLGRNFDGSLSFSNIWNGDLDLGRILAVAITVGGDWARTLSAIGIFSESIGISSDWGRILNLNRLFDSSLSISNNLNRWISIGRLFDESFSVSAGFNRVLSLSRSFDGVISLSGDFARKLSLNRLLNVAINFSDILNSKMSLGRNLAVAITVAGDWSRTLSAIGTFTEGISVSGDWARWLGLTRGFDGAISLSGGWGRWLGLGRTFSESITVSVDATISAWQLIVEWVITPVISVVSSLIRVVLSLASTYGIIHDVNATLSGTDIVFLFGNYSETQHIGNVTINETNVTWVIAVPNYETTLEINGSAVGNSGIGNYSTANISIINETGTGSSVATVVVHGTEYSIGSNGKIVSHFLNADGDPVNDENCSITIYYPNGTMFINNSNMSYMNGTYGIYYYNFTVPDITGVYPVDVNCSNPTAYGSSTFHVPSWGVTIDEINETVVEINDTVTLTYEYLIGNITTDLDEIIAELAIISIDTADISDIYDRLDKVKNRVYDIYNTVNYLELAFNVTQNSKFSSQMVQVINKLDTLLSESGSMSQDAINIAIADITSDLSSIKNGINGTNEPEGLTQGEKYGIFIFIIIISSIVIVTYIYSKKKKKPKKTIKFYEEET